MTSYCDVVDERLIFCVFPLEGLCGKSIIAICKFINCTVRFCVGFFLVGDDCMGGQ